MSRLTVRVTAPAGSEGEPIAIGEEGGWIGRAPDNEIALADPQRSVSSRHARIDWDGSTFGLTDQSLNGTELNGRRLTRAERTTLRPGDEIAMGPFRLTVVDSKSATTAKPPPTFTATEPRFGEAPVSQEMPVFGEAADFGATPVRFDDPPPRFGNPPPRFGDAPADMTVAGPQGYKADQPVDNRSDPTGLFTLSLGDLIGPDAPPEPAPPPRVTPTFAEPPPPPPAFVPAAYAPPPEPPPPAWVPETQLADPAALLAAFWRGLGIGAPHAATPAVMEELGLAMHEALVGVAALPGADGRENPLADGVRDIRQHLNAPQPRLAQHVRAAFAANQGRVAAIHAAVTQAVSGLAETLSARALEERLGKAVRTRMPVFRRAEMWRQFKALEGEIRDAAQHRFHLDLAERLRGVVRRMPWETGTIEGMGAPRVPGSMEPAPGQTRPDQPRSGRGGSA